MGGYGGRASGGGDGRYGDPYGSGPPPALQAKRNWASQPTPPFPAPSAGGPHQAQLPNGLGGRIKRFTDVQAQV